MSKVTLGRPKNRTKFISGTLTFPTMTYPSGLLLRDAAQRCAYESAPNSSILTLKGFAARLESEYFAEEYPNLNDELSSFIDDANVNYNLHLAEKLEREFRVCKKNISNVVPAIEGDGQFFLDTIKTIHRALGEGADTFRVSAVAIGSDRLGNQVIFPHHTQCIPLLLNLHAFLQVNFRDHPVLSAIVSYGALIHAHPFNDGNGRTSRVIFNLLAMAGTNSGHFLPIRGIAGVSLGGFLITLRRALYGGEWEPLQKFFGDGLRLSAKLQQFE